MDIPWSFGVYENIKSFCSIDNIVFVDKIKRALGIELMPVSAKEGMRKTLDSFR